MRLLVLALAAIALAGCESTQEQSAKLEEAAKENTAHRVRPSISIARQSTIVTVDSAAVLHSSEGTAAVVTLHNTSATALRNVPIAIDVKSTGGATLYTNATPGEARALVSVPLLTAHATSTWVDDQVQVSAAPASISAEVGEGERVPGAIPSVAVAAARLSEGAAEGDVVNHSSVGQRELVVYAVARRAGRVVAAGRAVIPQSEPGSTEHFQAFVIGDASGAQLEVSAPPTTFG